MDSSKASKESMKLFADELVKINGDGLFVPASEDEVITVEHLLVELEPKYNDLVDSVLGFGAFNLRKCFNIEELSALDYGHVETNADKLNSGLIQREKTTNELFDSKLEGMNDDLSDGTNNLPDIYEDYLLDTEFEEGVSDLKSVPSKGSCMGNLDLDHHSADSGQGQCGSEVVELSTSSNLVPEATCDKKSSLLDKMTIDELHVAFRNMFRRETTVTNKQWLKHCILFGLQNLDSSNHSLSLLECHVTSNENEGEMVVSKNDALPLRASSPLTGVFNFKTKPRARHMRRERHGKCDSLKILSVDISKPVFSLPELGEQESVIVTKRRRRRTTQRYMDESVAQNTRSQRRKFEDSAAFSKDKPLHIGSERQRYRKESRATALVQGVGKKPFEGACIQVPFGLPLEKKCSKKKGHKFEACLDSGSLGKYVDSDVEPYSAESQDFSSEDDCVARTKMHNSKGRRKHHISWSLPEVLKLVQGVSEYGVGRWTDIKRLLFPSSLHRTSVDLKDKWRNLLRASCKCSESERVAESRKKHTSPAIPQHILHRVRELAVIYPYPRKHDTKISRDVAIASNISVECDNLLPLSMTVRL